MHKPPSDKKVHIRTYEHTKREQEKSALGHFCACRATEVVHYPLTLFWLGREKKNVHDIYHRSDQVFNE